MNRPIYELQHLCIYDHEPRSNMWPWLKWWHALSHYTWARDEFHITDEGHVDYTFFACGSAFQIQLESPPYQFEYERNWHSRHGSAYNHLCWIVDDAKASFEHLAAAGCEMAQEYTEFGVYAGFVAGDPEGRWIEIMQYTDYYRMTDVNFRPAGVPGLQMFGATQLTKDLAGQVDWYGKVMGLRPIHGSVDDGIVFLADPLYSAERNVVMILAEPHTDAERAEFAKHGPLISAIDYQAIRLEDAYADALLAGFDDVSSPVMDGRTGLITAIVREPSGNLVNIREMFVPAV